LRDVPLTEGLGGWLSSSIGLPPMAEDARWQKEQCLEEGKDGFKSNADKAKGKRDEPDQGE